MPRRAPRTVSSPRLDNSCIDEFGDLVPYRRVLHVVLQRLRIALCLLQNTLHYRISHDFLSIRVVMRKNRGNKSSTPPNKREKQTKGGAPQLQGPASRAPAFPDRSHSRVAH